MPTLALLLIGLAAIAVCAWLGLIGTFIIWSKWH